MLAGPTPRPIPHSLWEKLVPSEYVTPSLTLQLVPSQVGQLLNAQTLHQLSACLTPQQQHQVQQFIRGRASQTVAMKINNRSPKDMPIISRQVHKLQDLFILLHSSQYMLEGLYEGQPAELLVREHVRPIAEQTNVYEVWVRGGYIVGIGQKYCDHIEPAPSPALLRQLIDCIQTILPAVTMVSPQGSELNSFLASIYCTEQALKITALAQYPPLDDSYHIFTSQELEQYYADVEGGALTRSQDQLYEQNEGVVPLVRTVAKEAEIKHYDMGEYLAGNELDNGDKLNEWKQFIKQAQSKLQQ